MLLVRQVQEPEEKQEHHTEGGEGARPTIRKRDQHCGFLPPGARPRRIASARQKRVKLIRQPNFESWLEKNPRRSRSTRSMVLPQVGADAVSGPIVAPHS